MIYLDGNEKGGITRRDALRGTLLASSVLAFPSLLAACATGSEAGKASGASAGGGSSDWMQFKGATLNFISENTAESAAIAADSAAFTRKTGIIINIQQMELGALTQKVALDFGSGRAAYDIIYADPYQVLAPYYEGLVDLNVFMQDKSLPQVPGGIEDFIPSQLLIDGRFLDESKLYALPYDCATMIWFYRKDIFAKFKNQMSQALGFEGFPELQAAARDEYRRAREGDGAPVDLGAQPLFPIDQTEFEAALAADHVNVEETARRLDREQIEASVELISRSDRIVLCGTDQMAFFASYLRHLLMLLDLRVEVVASPSQEGLAKLGRVDEKTVMVGFSAGRPHPLVVRAMKLARNRRAATIAIADATLSEIAKLADHKLYYSSNSPAYVRSHSALLGVIQAVAYGVYAQDEPAYADRIKAFRLK